jgi:L-rhamnose mutarotase
VQTLGMTLCLRDDPEAIDRYKHEHRHAWPPVVALLQACGFRSIRIFLRGRRLFMTLEADDAVDVPGALARLTDDPDYRAWDELMRTLQEPAPEAAAGEWWAEMELVFDLGWFPAAGGSTAAP